MPAILPPPQPTSLYAVSPPQTDPFPDEEFVNQRDIPVFAEHETTTRDGRTLKFGIAELQAVADRCNRRIQETGDYAALSIGHNPEPEAKARGAPVPRAVGYAGPFRVGHINGRDGTKKNAILADLHIFKDDWKEARKYGRRSAELWVEDQYEEMFLDPIALLGAETPRLDLGLNYSKPRFLGFVSSKWHPGKQILKYAATFPGTFNTHLPAQKEYAMDSNNMPQTTDQAQPDLIRGIVDAMTALPEWQFLQTMMAEKEAEGQTDQLTPGIGDPTDSVGDAQAGPPGAMPPAAGGPQVNPPSPPPSAASSPPGMPPMAAGGPPQAPQEPSPPQAKEQQPPTQQKPPIKPKETNSMPANYQAAMYAAMDGLDDDTLEQYMAGRKAKRYAAEGEVDGEDEPENAGAGTYTQPAGSAPGVSAEGEKTIKEAGAEEPNSTGKASYSRDSAQSLKYQLDDVTMRLKNMEAEREKERTGRIDAERRQRLVQYQHQGFFPGDIESAMEKLCYAKLRDEQLFEDTLGLIIENAPVRIPVGMSLPYVEGAEKYERHRPGFKDETAEKYSKEVQETARKNVSRRVNQAAANHERVDTSGWYAEELEKVASLNGAA